MRKCEHCGEPLNVGDTVHVVDKKIFCSRGCTIFYLTNDVIRNAKALAIEQYEAFAKEEVIKHTSDSATCHTCGKDLATCEAILAAEGNLYCSRECGIQHYKGNPENAERLFLAYAEEVTPAEIGLEVSTDE